MKKFLICQINNLVSLVEFEYVKSKYNIFVYDNNIISDDNSYYSNGSNLLSYPVKGTIIQVKKIVGEVANSTEIVIHSKSKDDLIFRKLDNEENDFNELYVIHLTDGNKKLIFEDTSYDRAYKKFKRIVENEKFFILRKETNVSHFSKLSFEKIKNSFCLIMDKNQISDDKLYKSFIKIKDEESNIFNGFVMPFEPLSNSLLFKFIFIIGNLKLDSISEFEKYIDILQKYNTFDSIIYRTDVMNNIYSEEKFGPIVLFPLNPYSPYRRNKKEDTIFGIIDEKNYKSLDELKEDFKDSAFFNKYLIDYDSRVNFITDNRLKVISHYKFDMVRFLPKEFLRDGLEFCRDLSTLEFINYKGR